MSRRWIPRMLQTTTHRKGNTGTCSYYWYLCPHHAFRALLRVVICGGGIIGASIAYYLTQLGVTPTIIEKESIACAASGKAGGFLALDWNDRSAVGKLSRKSFVLHAELADKFGADSIGYRRVHTLQLAGSEKPLAAKKRGADVFPSWIDGNAYGGGVLGSPKTTAQVHPYKLTNVLVDAAKRQGAKVMIGTAQGLERSPEDKQVTGVLVDGQTIPADVAVIALGPWSSVARQWGLKTPEIACSNAYSIVLQPPEGANITNHCLFTTFKYATGQTSEPEVYPRPDGTVYICGPGDSDRIPDYARDSIVRDQIPNNLIKVAASLSSSLANAEVLTRQTCYLPLSPDGPPAIGEVPGEAGQVYIAAGHSCWGILNAPATGLAIAESIVYGQSKSVDISGLSPARFYNSRVRA